MAAIEVTEYCISSVCDSTTYADMTGCLFKIYNITLL